jgi:hypothetical protein
MAITAGDRVDVVNAWGEHTERIALTGVVQGRDFEVVVVCMPDEISAAEQEGREPEGSAWPVEDVHPLQTAQ